MRAGRMLVLTAVVFLLAALPAGAQNPAQAAFEKLKMLAGEWEGTSGDGKPATLTYRLTSNGTVLSETLKGEDGEMMTNYYVDGDRLMVTHFCAAGNQPRMRAPGFSPDGKSISFTFQDATNLPDPGAGHMHSLVVTLVDGHHFTQQWTWREKGKDDAKDLFKLTRKK